MKLFVVNEAHADPNKWSIWSEWSLVLAENEDHARVVASEGPNCSVCEIPTDRALHLVKMSEPAWGNDL